jgi:L-iditol 2-dehydrogenase
MNGKMQALFKTAKGEGHLALSEADIPHPKADEVLIEIKAAGICGTDVHILHDQYPYWPPVILGHEFSGQIVEVGKQVSGYRVGERVVGEPHTLACGKCELCRTGYMQLCASKRSIGWGIHGAFARYMALPEKLLHHIPDTMSFDEAALVEPTANVVQDVIERGGVQANDFVAVSGPGPIGLLAMMAARAAGASQVALIGVQADVQVRLAVGRELGADHIIVADAENAAERIGELTAGRGADVVVEASGAPAAIVSSVGMVRRLGRIVVIGMTGREQISFPWDAAIWKMCTVIFNLSTGYSSWEKAIGLIAAGKIDAARLITHRMPLAEWQGAFAAAEKGAALKALLVP